MGRNWPIPSCSWAWVSDAGHSGEVPCASSADAPTSSLDRGDSLLVGRHISEQARREEGTCALFLAGLQGGREFVRLTLEGWRGQPSGCGPGAA